MRSSLELIPKCRTYINYVLNMILKIPRVDKYNIGSELKNCSFDMLKNIVYLSKGLKRDRLVFSLNIDCLIIIQREYIRIMYSMKSIDEKKYMTSISMLDELGKMIGGYIKSIGVEYGKEK